MVTLRNHPFEPILRFLNLPEPLLIKVISERDCKPGEPFLNTERKAQKRGGEPVLGWHLFELEFTLEAHLHAIYKSPNGYLVDITPWSEEFIPFVPIEGFYYEGKQRVRVNKTANKIIDDVILLQNALDDFYLEFSVGNFRVSGQNQFKAMMFNQIIEVLQEEARANRDIFSKCFCGSRKRYSDCHHKSIQNFINAMFSRLTLIEYKKKFGHIFSNKALRSN